MVLTVGQIPRPRRHQLGRRERGVVAAPSGGVYPDMVVDEVSARLPRVVTMIQLHLRPNIVLYWFYYINVAFAVWQCAARTSTVITHKHWNPEWRNLLQIRQLWVWPIDWVIYKIYGTFQAVIPGDTTYEMNTSLGYRIESFDINKCVTFDLSCNIEYRTCFSLRHIEISKFRYTSSYRTFFPSIPWQSRDLYADNGTERKLPCAGIKYRSKCRIVFCLSISYLIRFSYPISISKSNTI